MPEVVMFCSLPAAGKSSKSTEFKNHLILSRDKVGGLVQQLLPRMTIELLAGRNLVLDNTNGKIEWRAPFIKAAKEAGATIRCIWMDTAIEDCTINCLMRMWDRYGEIYFDAQELKPVDTDPNMFPPAVLFRMKNEFEPPTVDEGFDSVERIKFQRRPWPAEYCHKALFLDYDDTLRRTMGGGKWPTSPSEIDILPNRKKVLDRYVAEGYLLLGVSNQSGVGVGGSTQTLTFAQADACFNTTNKMLGHDIVYKYCPHRAGAIMCYCRKPQSGYYIHFIRHYKLNPKLCIAVGDMTTDKTAATRVGVPFEWANDFFKP